MVRAKQIEERVPCACGHAVQLHSNEACEAIRCTCRVTRKILAKKVTARPVAPIAKPAKAAPGKRVPKRAAAARKRDAAEGGDTQAA